MRLNHSNFHVVQVLQRCITSPVMSPNGCLARQKLGGAAFKESSRNYI